MRDAAWDLTQWVYPIEHTDEEDVLKWVHRPRVLLTDASQITWTWFHDDRANTKFIYAFGLLPSNVGDLYVARFPDPSSLSNYSAWQFLHKGAPAFPGGPPQEDWRRDELLSDLWKVATHVSTEFSIHKLTLGGVTRWLLVHSFWKSLEVPYEGIADYYGSGIGVFRVSGDEDLTSGFGEDESQFPWVDVRDVDPAFNNGDPLYSGSTFRGFSLHRELEEPGGTVRYFTPFTSDVFGIKPGSLSWEPHSFPVIVGYTIFYGCFEQDKSKCPPDPVWVQVNCAGVGDGLHCGARRFAVVDLAEIWPTLEERRLGVPDVIGSLAGEVFQLTKPPPPPSTAGGIDRPIGAGAYIDTAGATGGSRSAGIELFQSPGPERFIADSTDWSALVSRSGIDRPLLGGSADAAARVDVAAFADPSPDERAQMQELSRLSLDELNLLVSDVTSGRLKYELSATDRAALATVTHQDWAELVQSIRDLGSRT